MICSGRSSSSLGQTRILLSVLLFLVAFSSLSFRNVPHERSESAKFSEQSISKHANSSPFLSSTGRKFSGGKKNTYDGNRIFQQNLRIQGKSSRPLSNLEPSCPRWGVVTTVFAPSKAIKKFVILANDSENDWCLVIVADSKTPIAYMDDLENESLNMDKLVFLSTLQQEDLMAESSYGAFIAKTPWKHFSRKNIGYLYAISHGANYIFDFDDDNELIEDSRPFEHGVYVDTVRFVLTNPGLVYNPYPAFLEADDDSRIWPRGFPL